MIVGVGGGGIREIHTRLITGVKIRRNWSDIFFFFKAQSTNTVTSGRGETNSLNHKYTCTKNSSFVTLSDENKGKNEVERNCKDINQHALKPSRYMQLMAKPLDLYIQVHGKTTGTERLVIWIGHLAIYSSSLDLNFPAGYM